MIVRRIASTSVLRRRLAGEQRRPGLGAIEDLAFRRRSRRERYEDRSSHGGAISSREVSGG
jgi:hypothetical protein